jgi:hypothetical protein
LLCLQGDFSIVAGPAKAGMDSGGNGEGAGDGVLDDIHALNEGNRGISNCFLKLLQSHKGIDVSQKVKLFPLEFKRVLVYAIAQENKQGY